MSAEADRLRDSIAIGERQLAGMVQSLGRLEAEATHARDRVAAASSALEALRGRLRQLVEAGGWAA